MKINRISAYKLDLPRQGTFTLSGGRSVAVFNTTVVKIETDSGLIGLGEVCPFGSAYLPAYANGARTGIAELAPQLVGQDPRQVEALYRFMDGLLKGHPYVKSAIDIALWDILGQAAGLPLYVLLGGKHGQSIPLYQPISHDAPARMAAQVQAAQQAGYRRFQPKVGGEPEEDIARIRAVAAVARSGDYVVADANGGWLTHQAKRFVTAMHDAPIFVEQPCASYDECLTIRGATNLPFVLDESIDSVSILLRAHRDRAADLINLKLAKVGGITPARQIRDLCVTLGIAMTIEDSGGGDVIAAAITHLAQSTPEKSRYALCNAYFLVNRHIAQGVPPIVDGAVTATDAPGLGLTLRGDELGTPFFTTG